MVTTGGEAHVMAGFTKFKKEGKRGEDRKLLLAEVSALENKTSIFGDSGSTAL